MLALWLAPLVFTYWVEPCTRTETTCRHDDPQLAVWALESWQRASEGGLEFRRVEKREQAQIRIHWVEGNGGLYGEARPMVVNGKRGAEIHVLPDTRHLGRAIAEAAANDPLLRHAIVYLTCLHESGHAIGLPHTAAFDDIMYSFGHGGDIGEYFLRYRRKLGAREDIRRQSGISIEDKSRLRTLLTSGVP
ncbi:MAG: matrixin family metalloprotease [Acidobacteria bacterium]|nr:matrixin family metalloprotease [Acidobacteriota bacterium]